MGRTRPSATFRSIQDTHDTSGETNYSDTAERNCPPLQQTGVIHSMIELSEERLKKSDPSAVGVGMLSFAPSVGHPGPRFTRGKGQEPEMEDHRQQNLQ